MVEKKKSRSGWKRCRQGVVRRERKSRISGMYCIQAVLQRSSQGVVEKSRQEMIETEVGRSAVVGREGGKE